MLQKNLSSLVLFIFLSLTFGISDIARARVVMILQFKPHPCSIMKPAQSIWETWLAVITAFRPCAGTVN